MILRMEAIFVQYCPTKIRAYFTKAALSAANHIKEIAMRQIQAMQNTFLQSWLLHSWKADMLPNGLTALIGAWNVRPKAMNAGFMIRTARITIKSALRSRNFPLTMLQYAVSLITSSGGILLSRLKAGTDLKVLPSSRSPT